MKLVPSAWHPRLVSGSTWLKEGIHLLTQVGVAIRRTRAYKLLSAPRALRWLEMTLAGTMVALLVVCAVVLSDVNIGCDHTAILVDLAADGTVTLGTHDGNLMCRLAGVRWPDDSRFIGLAKPFLDAAQSDWVEWGSSSEGIHITYQTESGTASLNKQLSQLASQLSKQAG